MLLGGHIKYAIWTTAVASLTLAPVFVFFFLLTVALTVSRTIALTIVTVCLYNMFFSLFFSGLLR